MWQTKGKGFYEIFLTTVLVNESVYSNNSGSVMWVNRRFLLHKFVDALLPNRHIYPSVTATLSLET